MPETERKTKANAFNTEGAESTEGSVWRRDRGNEKAGKAGKAGSSSRDLAHYPFAQ